MRIQLITLLCNILGYKVTLQKQSTSSGEVRVVWQIKKKK